MYNFGNGFLLAATGGILHEARVYRNRKLEWKVSPALLSFLAVGGATLVGLPVLAVNAVGLAGLSIDFGIFLIVASSTLYTPREMMNDEFFHASITLFISAIFALICIGIRLFDMLYALTIQKRPIDQAHTTMAYLVTLKLMSEVIATISYICAGIMTQHTASKLAKDEGPVLSLPQVRPHEDNYPEGGCVRRAFGYFGPCRLSSAIVSPV